MTEARVDQQIREARIQEQVNARVDQLVREAALSDTVVAARVDQLVREAAIADTVVGTRVNQLVREAWIPLGNAYLNQLIREAWIPVAVPAPTPSSGGCDTAISVLAENVFNRLEESNPPVLWNAAFEIYTALVEAENDLLMLVGRPTQTVNQVLDLTPNTVWQTVPKGIFLITNIWGAKSQLRKTTLFDLDFSQSSWGSDWQNDTSDDGPRRWAPIGMTMFAVHPAPSVPTQVTIDAVSYPVASDNFPYLGSEIVPFHHEFFEALEMYATVYARLKETGPEFQNALPIYQNYLALAARLTQIEDRRDPMIFTRAFGSSAGVNSLVKR